MGIFKCHYYSFGGEQIEGMNHAYLVKNVAGESFEVIIFNL